MRLFFILLIHAFSVIAFATSAIAENLAIAEADSSESTMAIRSVERKNNILTVKGMFTKQGGDANFRYHTMDRTFLLDAEKGVKYFPLKDTRGTPLASNSIYLHGNGNTLKFWVKFPAPPAEKKSISLYVSEFEPLEDLPITDK